MSTRYTHGFTDPRGIYYQDDEPVPWGEMDLRDRIMADIRTCAPISPANMSFHRLRTQVLNMILTKPIYRILIKNDNSIETDCYDMIDLFKPELNKSYSSIDDLPIWVKERLAVLSMLDPDKRNEEIEGVGRRIARNVYWVYKGEE